jgi:hypothetical protein
LAEEGAKSRLESNENPGVRMNPVQMASQLYDCRDKVKRFLGETYHERMQTIGKAVMAVSVRDQCDTLAAGIRLAKTVDGMDAVMILAATVELVEPNPAKIAGGD